MYFNDSKSLVIHKHIWCSFPPDYDDCASRPCMSGATCVDRVNSYICTCQAGYIGSRCETGRFPFGYVAIF